VEAAAFRAPVEPLEIFERDGWICQLCGKPVSRGAVWPDLLSPTIDHIVPLRPREGEPRGFHEPANAQCAHYSCNSRKNNEAALRSRS
jgi:5-methylcytosine-specific restriction endonuclease McrA